MKTTITIEGKEISLHIDRPEMIYLNVVERLVPFEVVDVFPEGFTFRLTDFSTMSYHWNSVKEPLFVCSICGNLHFRGYSNPIGKRMIDQHICFSCAFWEERSEQVNPIVINGHRYSVGMDGVAYPGMGGRRFDIEFFDGRVITTHNLWHNGEVPQHFRDRIPDTARFINGAGFVSFPDGTGAWDSSKEKTE